MRYQAEAEKATSITVHKCNVDGVSVDKNTAGIHGFESHLDLESGPQYTGRLITSSAYSHLCTVRELFGSLRAGTKFIFKKVCV